MNQRKAGTLLSYAYIIITNTISLFYTPYMLRMMGQSEYGLYGTASSFISYLSVLSFGIGGAYIRFNAKARATGDREEERRLNGMFYCALFTGIDCRLNFYCFGRSIGQGNFYSSRVVQTSGYHVDINT